MKLQKSLILGIIATLALGLSVGCNGKTRSKKTRKNTEAVAPAEQAEGQKVEEESPEALKAEADRRFALNKSLASMSKIRVEGVSCDASTQSAIVSYPSMDAQSTILDRLKKEGANAQAIKEASRQIKANMLQQKDSACNLIVVKDIADIFQKKVAVYSSDKHISYEKEKAFFDKVEAVVDSFALMATGATMSLKAQQAQVEWDALVQRKDRASSQLSAMMAALDSEKSSFYDKGDCREVNSDYSCGDFSAEMAVVNIDAFEKQVELQTSNITEEMMATSASEEKFQISNEVALMEELVDQASGLLATLPLLPAPAPAVAPAPAQPQAPAVSQDPRGFQQ